MASAPASMFVVGFRRPLGLQSLFIRKQSRESIRLEFEVRQARKVLPRVIADYRTEIICLLDTVRPYCDL